MSSFNSNQIQLENLDKDSQQNSEEIVKNQRILIVDDNEAIHSDFGKILGKGNLESDNFKDAKAAFFGTTQDDENTISECCYELDSALQGRQALELVQKSIQQEKPYALAFVDMRMPPGWDGLETVQRIWEVDPEIQIVFCTAYSDHSWEEFNKILGRPDQFIILKKPFDHLEIKQLTVSLTKRWQMLNQLKNSNQNNLNNSSGIEKIVSENQVVVDSKQLSVSDIKSDNLTSAKVTESFKKNIVQQITMPVEFLRDHLENAIDNLQQLDQLIDCCSEVIDLDSQSSSNMVCDKLKSVDPESIRDTLKHTLQGSFLGMQKLEQLLSELETSESDEEIQIQDKMNSVK